LRREARAARTFKHGQQWLNSIEQHVPAALLDASLDRITAVDVLNKRIPGSGLGIGKDELGYGRNLRDVVRGELVTRRSGRNSRVRASASRTAKRRASPAPLPYLRQTLAIARFKPGMHEVVEIYSRQQGPNWQ
jgi:hypothetical protein